MYKQLFFTCLFSAITLISFAQDNEWKEYFGNENISIQYHYTECHNPAKGIHHENVLLRLHNNTTENVTVSYHLQRIYNGKEVGNDVPSEYTFIVPAHAKMESTCDDLQDGLYVFSKILDLKANSVLNSFDLKNLTINGQPVAR